MSESGATASLEIDHVGGIEHREMTFEPGVTILAGENATNRTSILRAIAGVCGSDRATLHASAEEGSVRLSIDGETYTRTLKRAGSGSVRFGGEPFLDDPTAADRFAFLLADNETRQAVVTEGDLRSLVMDPIDLAEIEREVAQLREERAAVDEQLKRRNHLREERLPDLRARRDRVRTEIETVSADLAEARTELAAADRDVAESRSVRAEVEETLSTLQETRGELQDRKREREAEEASLESARERLGEIEREIEELDPPAADREELEETQSELWDRKERLDERIERLQTLIEFNERFRSAEASTFEAIEAALDVGEAEGDRAERLAGRLADPDRDSLVCWTCGQPAERADIDGTIEALEQYRQGLFEEYATVEDRIETVESKLERAEQWAERRDRLLERRERTEREIERTERTVASLTDRIASLEGELEDLEAELSALETEADYQRVIDLQEEVTELEVERESLEGTLADLEEEIGTVEAELADLEDLEDARAEIEAALTERRTRIDRLEAETVEAFNDHMAALLDRLAFENIERVWIERKGQGEGTDGSVFDLHVVRSHADGTVFEDTVRNLSESERQVVALVFALAGNLAHEVHEEVPFMLLDSVEMIDATRKARLLEHFAGYHTYLVAVVLTEELEAILAEFEPERVIEVGDEAADLSR